MRSNTLHRTEKGFTITELIVVMALTAAVTTIAYTFFNSSIRQYLTLQQDGLNFSELSMQSQRVAAVMRGSIDVTNASYTEMTLTAYFSPNDSYVSQIRYYKSAAGTELLADVVPYTANPPIGTLDTNQARTVTIIDNFKTKAGVNTFEYVDSGGQNMTVPIADLHTIKGLRINLVSGTTATSTSINVQVSLRNRKTNL